MRDQNNAGIPPNMALAQSGVKPGDWKPQGKEPEPRYFAVGYAYKEKDTHGAGIASSKGQMQSLKKFEEDVRAVVMANNPDFKFVEITITSVSEMSQLDFLTLFKDTE